MGFLTDHDLDGWRTEESVTLDIPTCALEYTVAGQRQRR